MQKYRIMSLNVNDFGGKVYHLQEYKYFNKNKNKNSRNTDQPDYKGDGLSFISEEKNGKLFGRGSNGETFEAKNYEELNKLIAGSYKKENEKRPDKGKNSIVEYHTSDKNPQKMAAFAKAFINEGIAVGGDVPQDPKFWQNLKKEYLNNPEHSIDETIPFTSHSCGIFSNQSTRVRP